MPLRTSSHLASGGTALLNPPAFGAQPQPRRILIVEDDPRIAEQLSRYLEGQGYETTVLANGLQVEPEVRRLEPSLILLDLMLPGLDGLEVCHLLRRFSAVPIIIVTARADEIDRLLGLEGGADDYVCKPFSPRELLARMKALLRRAEGRLQTGMTRHGFTIDEGAQRIAWEDSWLPLTPVEFRLLRKLLSRPGHVFSRGSFLDGAGDRFSQNPGRVIDSHIKNLRRKIAAIRPQGSAIVSVYGMGYRFDPAASDVG
ncbi:MAG: response regulator [Ramlibacter sp.]|nr:response regulator [Ramlibacter sp.]